MAAEDLGVLRVSLGMDDSQFTSSVQQINARLNALRSEFRATASGVEGFEQSLEGMRAKSENLTRVLNLQRDKAQRLRQEYEQAAATYGENSVQAQRLMARYNQMVTTINRTQTQLNQLNNEIALQENRWHQLSLRLNETSQNINAIGDKAKDAGGKLTAGLTAPITAAGVAVGMVAAQFEDAQVKIQNSLGLSADEAENFSEVAQNVWSKGFGESLETVSDALIRVKQNIKGISDEAELERVTRDAIILADTFESDVNEVTRAGQNLMHNFGVTSDEAFNLMANGAQKGLNFSNEMFDNLAEYSGLFAKMGYSADEYFGILQRGSEAGVYNLDYINDIMKEFQIRIKDGSDATSTAFADLTKESQDVWDAFYYGKATVKDVAKTVVNDLKSMEDQTYANQLGVSLFGTKWEDLESDAVYAMLSTTNAMETTTDALGKMAKAQEQTFNQRWQSLLRQAQEKLEPIGKEVLKIAEDFLPKLSKGLDIVVGWFADLDDEGQNLVLTLTGIAAAAGPLLMGGGMIANGVGGVVSLASSFASAASKGGLLATSLGAFTGPVGLGVMAATGIGALTVALINNKETSVEATEKMLELQEETFNTAMASYDAAEKNAELAKSYDELRDKSSLSVDELLRYKEVQSQLETTTAPDKVAILKDELVKLQEKSGLTSDELARMIGLDQQIIDTVPGVESAYDSKGNAVIKYSDAVKQVTQAQLELQKAEAMAVLTKTIDGLGENIAKLNELRESYVSLSETKTNLEKQQFSVESELARLEQERLTAKSQGLKFDEQAIDVHSRQMEISREKREIENQMKDATGSHLELLKQQEATLESERIILNGANGELMTREEYLRESLRLIGEELATNGESLSVTSQEKALIEEKLALSKLQYNQILNTLAQEVGVTAEEGKQLEAMQSQYNKNAEIIKQLQTQKSTAQGLTAEEQNRLNELINQNTQIGNNISEAELLNSTLSKDITKELGIEDHGEVEKMNKEVSKEATKSVKFQQAAAPFSYSSAIESLFTSPATKYVQFRTLGSLPEPVSNYQGTTSFEGGSTFVGELGVERAVLPSGRKLDLGVNGMELVNLPKGTKILNHLETAKQDGLLPSNVSTIVPKDFSLENKLKNLMNVRWFAEGGIMTGPTVFGQMGNTVLAGGEAGPEAILPLNGFYKNLDNLFKNYLSKSSGGTNIHVNAEPTAKAIAREVDRAQRKLLFGI